MKKNTKHIIASRKKLIQDLPHYSPDPIEEGGCGVVGFAATVPVSGRHIFEPSFQMRNRGNGKGGGIAAAGLVAQDLGVDAKVLKDNYILQVALLEPKVKTELEKEFIAPYFDVEHTESLGAAVDYREIGLEVQPPDVARYFVRVKDKVFKEFQNKHGLQGAAPRVVEDEFVYQNSFCLNQKYYASLGDKQAFVMSHARDLIIFKIVGYAEQVVQYYGLEDFKANVWIAHQRYPTKGRVWHPAGAHPFIGMNEALVHNGDFANYHSISSYLKQHNIAPLFLTDTEVSVLIFDLLHRTYGYPLEYIIEALAPTTELDFDRLPSQKKEIYRAIQATHVQGSPDGPWFFIIARSDTDNETCQLLGITDTAMLRPQVFALQEGDVSIGLIASEKQAIDATLESLSDEDSRFRPIADRYWNARGGSSADGGAFTFTLTGETENRSLVCADKFGQPVVYGGRTVGESRLCPGFEDVTKGDEVFLRQAVSGIVESALKTQEGFEKSLERLSLINNRRFDCGAKKRSLVLQIVREGIFKILNAVPAMTDPEDSFVRRMDWGTRHDLRKPLNGENVLVINAKGFAMEGEDCDARLLVRAYELGWRRFVVYGSRGQRFVGCGFGMQSEGVRIDVFGSSGDYLASGIDGIEIHVHDNAQDQLGQIMKRGTLVVHGDVGQAFMYGAKGGDVFVLGNAAGRPFINAVGSPRAVINGTCLDFLAESFMAGDPLQGGGFVVLNGLQFDDKGCLRELDSPYPGANLFSLASGGAIYVRDPYHKLVEEQLNGGEYATLTDEDWDLILPYLKKNEEHFGISVDEDLLCVDGVRKEPGEVYRKVRPVL